MTDITVVKAFEPKALKLSDFYFNGDDYRYRFEPEARQRFIDLLRERFNSGANYEGRILKWDTILEQKVGELGRFLGGKSTLDSAQPSPVFLRRDGRELKARILTMTHCEARKLGIGKNTFYYLRKRVQRESIRVYTPVRRKLETRI